VGQVRPGSSGGPAAATVKVVILAGGRGTRLAEVTDVRPKPMVEVGGRPILWHILKHYGHFGFNEFFIALGYRGEVIKKYFLDYSRAGSDMTIDLQRGQVELRNRDGADDWIVHLEDTGLDSQTGERIRRLRPYLESGTFMVTYGDGVADVRLDDLLEFHRANGRLATVTAVRPPARFGGIRIDGNLVHEFTEKSQADAGWINGGYLVFEPGVFEILTETNESLEIGLLERLARLGELACFRHERFWQCADTVRELLILRQHWDDGRPPWRVWSHAGS
jgi:glucose-1-phosphate cytidylyltransferase